MITASIGVAILLLIAFLGFPLGFAMIVVGVCGFALLRGVNPALEMAGQTILDLATSSEFGSLPLFILMGIFVYRSGISDKLYQTAQAWLGHYRGGLAMATVVACGGVAAVTGSSLATTATMARVSIPPMRKYGYSGGLAAGAVASGGTLGMLIPPSTPLLVYGILTNQHIGKLFIAGIIPGILLMLLFVGAIIIVALTRPQMCGVGERAEFSAKMRTLLSVWPVILMFCGILAGIYLGVFTASEAGGVGAVCALIFAMSLGRLSFRDFIESLVEAGRTTAMLFSVGFGALIINNFVVVAGMPNELVAWIESMRYSPTMVIVALAVIYLLLGTVFDGIALILLTVPIFFPVIMKLGVDPIWFGVFVVINAEISVISPPVGMNVFLVKSMFPEIDIWEIFNGTWPFFFAALVLLAIVVVWPQTVTFLPGMMR